MIKYKIALVNVFWSENENNTRYFINKNEQNSYFDSLASGKTSPLVNYNMGNNIVTTVVYKDTTSRRVDEVVKSNYAIVYTIDYNQETKEETILNRRYFFAYPRQDSGRQMIVDLVLDDVQTNYISQQNFFDSEVMIKRANLNRFVPDGNNFKFNIGTQDSPFYQVEDFKECPKRLTKYTSLDLHVDKSSDTSQFNFFFDDNIIGWEYVYLAPKDKNAIDYYSLQLKENDYDVKWVVDSSPIKSYYFESLDYRDDPQFSNGNACDGSVVCLCAPIYKRNSQNGYENSLHFVNGDYDISVSNWGLKKFLELNGMYSYVYARKFSLRPPFMPQNINTSTYSYDNYYKILSVQGSLVPTGLSTNSYKYINSLGCSILYTGYFDDGLQKYRQGCILVRFDYDGIEGFDTNEYVVDKQLSFTPTEIIEGSKDDVRLNPKLLSNQFFEVNISNFSQSFTYDFQKLATNNFRLKYNEALTPDVTKGYARIYGENGLYKDVCSINLTGLVISNDYSLMVANDKLSEMLANNKNFFMQQALNIGQHAIYGGLGGSMSGGGIGAVAGVTSGLLGIPNTIMNLDNMRNAPAQVRNANGNVYFASDIQPFKLTIEEYDIINYDKKAFNDYCYMFGYKYNRMGLLRDFVNIRAKFNYVEADLINVPMNMQNDEKRRLIEKFNNGIRFWNTDLMDFSSKNYENEVYEAYQNQQEVNNE